MLLEVKSLTKYYPNQKSLFSKSHSYSRAVNDVSFTLNSGNTLSLVGESGSGKTTTGKMILRLIEPTAGNIVFNNISLLELSKKSMLKMRKDMQIIFQDPYGSLNPRMTIYQLISEGISIHTKLTKKERIKSTSELLEMVGLSYHYLNRYPHEFSGGQRQRISIARAIALKPKLIICDESVSSLDVSIRAQILDLLNDLQSQFSISYLFITHDLNVAAHISDDIIVMFEGTVVEKATANDFFSKPLHPYSKSLLAAVPSIDTPERKRDIDTVLDYLTSRSNYQNGCNFYNRCPDALDICFKVNPTLLKINDNHFVCCHKF